MFISLHFRTFWPKSLNFFRSFQKHFGLWPKKTRLNYGKPTAKRTLKLLHTDKVWWVPLHTRPRALKTLSQQITANKRTRIPLFRSASAKEEKTTCEPTFGDKFQLQSPAPQCAVKVSTTEAVVSDGHSHRMKSTYATGTHTRHLHH